VALTNAAPRFEGAPVGFGVGGNAYMLGVRHPNSIWGTGDTQGWSRHNLARNFGSLTVVIGRLDGSGSQARNVRFLGDGRNLGVFTVTSDFFQPLSITIDVRDVSVLEIQIDAPGADGVTVALGNPTLLPIGAFPTPSPTPAASPTPSPSPVPFITSVPRYEEWPLNFAAGRNATLQGNVFANSIVGDVAGNGWSNHNLAGRFSTITATIGRQDGSGDEARTIRFIGDGRVLATYTVQGSVFNPATISVDVRTVSVLRIEIEAPGSYGTTAVLTNIQIH